MSAIEVREALRDDGSAIVEPTRVSDDPASLPCLRCLRSPHPSTPTPPGSWYQLPLTVPDCHAVRQIVAGVLVKFVNLGKGWRSRLFVLKHGVLRYYRVRADICLRAVS